MSDIQLKIDGVIHAGWKEARVGFSMDSIANSFELTLTDKWSEDSKPRPIKLGAACEILIDKTKVLTGYVDDVLPEYDATDHLVIVAGRTKSGDLVDSSHPGKQFKNRNIKQLADELCKPFGINVVVAEGIDIGAAFKSIEIETGETIFEFLEQAARIRALRLMSDIDGNVVITRASKNRITTPLILGENILSASGEFSMSDRFSEITVSGSKDGDDDGWGVAAAHIEGKYSDSFLTNLKRHRPAFILADGSVTIADCKKRAQWEVLTRHGRGQSIVYTVNGWHHDAGIWQPNVLVPVVDSYMGIDKDLLITEVQLIMDDKGQRAELRVMPREGFELTGLPEPEADDDIGWG